MTIVRMRKVLRARNDQAKSAPTLDQVLKNVGKHPLPAAIKKLTQPLLDGLRAKKEPQGIFFPERSAADIYYAIKNEFYKSDQWLNAYEEGSPIWKPKNAISDHLLEVIALASIGRFEAATQKYESLGQRYDKKKKSWFSVHDNGLKSIEHAGNDLLGVIAEVVVGSRKEALKQYKIVNKKYRKKLIRAFRSFRTVCTSINSQDLLLDTLAKYLFGENDITTYFALREQSLYDSDKGIWYSNMEVKLPQNKLFKNVQSADQLLDAALYPIVNRKTKVSWAKNNLIKLYESELFDNERGLWNYQIRHTDGKTSTSKFASDQLIGVIAHACVYGAGITLLKDSSKRIKARTSSTWA